MTPRAAEKRRANADDVLSEASVIDMIKAAQGEQSLRSFAKEIGVTVACLSDIYNGRRHPGPKVLQYFGVGKTRQTVVTYAFFRIR